MATTMPPSAACSCLRQSELPGKSSRLFSSSSRSNSIRSRASFSTRNQMVQFKARRVVSIPYREMEFPGEEYVKEVNRIVKVTFPDSSRIDYLSDGTWRSRLKPITFFNVSATPICFLRVYYKEATKVLQLESEKLVLEFLGFPPGLDDINLQFSLAGDLGVSTSSGNNRSRRFHGSVSLRLDCDLPLPFSLMPEAIVLPVADALLDRILAAMEIALLDGLVADYKLWCRKQSLKQPQQQNQPKDSAAQAAFGGGRPS